MKKTENSINHLDDKESKWFAIRTNFKHEKSVSNILSGLGIKVYLPLIEKVRKYTRKIKRYDVPLINNYVFVKIKKKEYIKVLQVQGVLGFIKIGRSLLSIPEEEIDILKKVVGEIKNVEAISIDKQNVIGKNVEIISGQLAGTRGKIIESSNKKIFVVELQNIGFSLSMEISAEHLKIIN